MGTSRPAGRRELTIAVLLCLVGGVAVLLAAGRAWRVEVVVRPAPLPAERVGRTGAALLPWVPALAVVALAGAGALLANRGVLRRAVGALLAAAGLGIAAGAVRFAGVSVLAVAAGLAGLLVAAGGALALGRAGRWPAMGARYERPSAPRPAAPGGTGFGETGPGAPAAAGDRPAAGPDGPAHGAQLWDALDRGEDPTATPDR